MEQHPSSADQQLRMFAQAIYEIRLLLSGHLGSQTPGDIAVRQAAHLAYALHNQAEEVLSGRPGDIENSLSRIQALDKMFNSNYAKKFSMHLPA